MLKDFFLIERKVLLQTLIACYFILFLYETTEFQGSCLLVFILDVYTISPVGFNFAIVNACSKQFKNLYLEGLEISSIDDGCFIVFRWLLTFLGFTYSCQVLSHSCQEFDNILMWSNSAIIDISMWFRERTFSQQLWIGFRILNKTQEMINVWNFTEMWTDGIQEQQLIIQKSFNQICSWLILAIQYIQIFHSSKIMESIFYYISINHFLICLFYFHDLFLHLWFEDLVEICVRTLLIFLSHLILLLKHFVHKHFESWKLYNSSVGVLFSEICIIDWITSQGTSETGWISAVLVDSINQSYEITSRFGHFLSLNQNITIAIICLWPEFRIIPDSYVIIKSHSQMIFNQIFSWASQIHWIPIKERLSNLIQFILRDFFRSILFSQQYEIPEIWCNILMSDTQNTNLWTVQISLQQMGKSIECKVNCWIWQWFNQILIVKRQFSTQTEWSWTSPLFEPVNSINQIVMENFTVTFELSLNIIQYFLLPLLMTIVDIPLITISYNTLFTRSWNDLSSRFVIFKSRTIFDKFTSNEVFSLSNFLTFVVSNNHCSLMESFFIALVFSLIQKYSIILTLNFKIFTNFQCWQITISWYIYNFNWIQINHLLGNSIFLSHWGFFSQIWNGHPIVRWITWYTSNNTSSFVHTDSHHRKGINFLMNSQRSSQADTHHVWTFQFTNDLNFLILFSQMLISHVSCWSLTTNKNFIIFHLNCTILSIWQQIATCLAIHSFRSQCSSYEEYFSPFQSSFFHIFIQFSNLYFNQSVFIRSDTLPFRSIMISTHLFIFWCINRWSFTKVNISFLFQLNKLPLYERIIIRVHICCYEWSSVIYMYTKSI